MTKPEDNEIPAPAKESRGCGCVGLVVFLVVVYAVWSFVSELYALLLRPLVLPVVLLIALLGIAWVVDAFARELKKPTKGRS